MREKNENNEHIIKSKLQEKDDALIVLSDQVMRLLEEVQQMKMSMLGPNDKGIELRQL